MSYILDALKKVEREKVKGNSRPGVINLSGELLRDEQRATSGAGGWKIWAMVLAASVLITFGATYLILKQSGGGVRSPKAAAPPVPPVTMVQPPRPPFPAPVQPPQAKTPVLPAVAQKAHHQTVKAPVKPSRHAKPASRLRQHSQKATAPARPLPQVRPRETPLALSPVPAKTDIKVSGIAWQDAHGARRAVVNGLLVREQAIVSGARIVDILPDRVRFEQGGTTFEVPLVSSGPLDTRK